MTNYIDANSEIIVLRTVVSNTDIANTTANTVVIAVGAGDGNSFSNIVLLTVDYTDKIEAISDKIDALNTKLDEVANNMTFMSHLASNVGIKTMEGFSWIQAAASAKLQLPYMLESFRTQAEPNTPFKYADEAYEVFNTSNSNLVNLRLLAANIPPYTTNTGGASIKAAVYIGDEEPIDPDEGDLWWNSSDGIMYIRYNDGDTTQWVSAMPNL